VAITTLDGALAGAQPPQFIAKYLNFILSTTNVPFSLWYDTGSPAAGAVPPTTATGVPLTAPVTGQIPHTNPPAGLNAYLARLSGATTGTGVDVQNGLMLLCDRLLHCGGTTAGSAIDVTSTSAQIINTQALPARDINGTANGVGVFAGIEVATAVGAATPTITLNYTNSAGTTGQSGVNINPTVGSVNPGHFWPIGVAGGDAGVRSVQSITFQHHGHRALLVWFSIAS
jgi:hypothetical protein